MSTLNIEVLLQAGAVALGKEPNMSIAPDSVLRKPLEEIIDRYQLSEEYREENPPEFSEKSEMVYLCITQHHWGKGRTLEEAYENVPTSDKKQGVVIYSIFLPAGCAYYPTQDQESPYDRVYVSEMGNVCYPNRAFCHCANEIPNLYKIIVKKQ